MKTINNIKDLEKVKILDEIKVNYQFENKKDNQTDEGIFAGSFNKKGEHYFVLSKPQPSKEYPGALFVSSSVYGVNESSLTFGMHNLTGFCHKNKLEEELTTHLNILSKNN